MTEYQNNAGKDVCKKTTECDADLEYETVAPTVSSDRRCGRLRVCKKGETASEPATHLPSEGKISGATLSGQQTMTRPT